MKPGLNLMRVQMQGFEVTHFDKYFAQNEISLLLQITQLDNCGGLGY